MEADTYPLFVYGTLLDPQVQQMVFGQEVAGQPDRLPGYEKRERSVAGRYPEIVPVAQEGALVQGQRLELGAAGLRRADAYETTMYYRKLVELESGARAWVYLASPPKKTTP